MNVIVEITVVRVSEFYIALVNSRSPSITPGWVRRAASGTTMKVFYAQLASSQVPWWNTSISCISSLSLSLSYQHTVMVAWADTSLSSLNKQQSVLLVPVDISGLFG